MIGDIIKFMFSSCLSMVVVLVLMVVGAIALFKFMFSASFFVGLIFLVLVIMFLGFIGRD